MKTPKPSPKLIASIQSHADQGVPLVSVDELHENPRNPKGEHDVGRIVASLQRFGWGRPLLYVAGRGTLEAGHGTLRAARALGLLEVPAIALDHDEGEALGYAIADNRIAERSRWREDVLAEELVRADEQTRNALGFDAAEADELLARVLDEERLTTATPGAKKKRKAARIDIRPPARSALGDLWILGRHRLVIGDSLDPAVRRVLLEPDGGLVDLVITDPPYAIYGSSTGIGADIADDRMVRPFFVEIAQALAEHLRIWGHAYVCCDWRSWPSIWDGFRSRLAPKNLIVWDKGGGGLGSSYANTYELVGFFARLPPSRAMKSHDERGQRPVYAPNLVRFNRTTGEDRNHNAAKPPDLIGWLMGHSSDEGATVLDLFGGGGSTMAAAEALGRSARLVEIAPDNADAIVERWCRLTGGTPERVERAVQAAAAALPDALGASEGA